MVDFLMMLHFEESLGLNMPVSPPEIPIRTILIFFDFPFELFGNPLNNFILTIYVKRIVPETLMIILSNRIFWIQLALNFGGMGSLYLIFSSYFIWFSFSLFFRFINQIINKYNLHHFHTIHLLICKKLS